MKHAAIFSFALAMIGMGLFIFGVSNGASSFEMTGFILTLPLTFIAALGLATIVIALAMVLAMAAWSCLAWSWAWACAWPRRRRG